MKFAQGYILYTSLSQTQRKRINICVCLRAGVLLCLLQAEKKRIHKLLLLDLSLNFSRSTKTTQCLSLSVAMVLSVYKLNFLYFSVLNTLQALAKPCDPFMKKRELLNPFPADKDRQAMHIQWQQVRKQIWESCCRFSLSP